MKCYNKIIIIILCFSVISPTFGFQPRLSTSKLSSLISQPIIAAIYRDRFGFLWIGTQEGLYKFDGANHTVFSSDQSNKNWIPISDIRGISEDAEGNLLVATYGGGLLKWDSSVSRFISNEKHRPMVDYIIRLYASKTGNIWLGTKDRIVLYDSNDGMAEEWIADNSIIDNIGRPYTFLENDTGILFVGTDVGLAAISAKNESVINYDLSSLRIKGKFGVTALDLDNQGNLIIGTDTGHVAVIDSENGNVISKTKLLAGTSLLVSDFIIYNEMLVIGTDQGLYLSDRELTFIKNIGQQGSGLSSSDIYCLFLDKNQVWVGTYNGLDLLSSSAIELFNDKNSGIHNDILTITQDNYDRIWVGTYDGLYLFNETSESHSRIENHFKSIKLKDNRITALAMSDSQLWIGYFRGGVHAVNIVTGGANTAIAGGPEDTLVVDISIDKDNKNVWIATNNHGLVRITYGKTYLYNHTSSLNERSIRKLFGKNNRLLVVSKSNKIYKYDNDKDHFSWLEFDFGLGPGKPDILSIMEDLGGNIWLGTKNHGIFKWPLSNQRGENLDLISLGDVSGLKTSTIYGIEVDSKGNLWCSTQNGVVKLSPEGKLIKRFTTADGLQGNDFTLGASFKSRQGLIYFGGTNGYNRFDPDRIEIDSTPSPMRLTRISLPTLKERSLGEVAELKSLQLTHRDHFVTFQFSVLDFIGAERNQYRYKLENFDTEWIDNGTANTATYTNLPKGDYVFRVQGANSSGIWNREGILLNVSVLPAPWHTWWAYSLYTLLFLILLWGMHRIYRSFAVERRSAELALEIFEAENKADDDLQEQIELQDDLARSAYQHNLSTLELISDSIKLRSANRSDSETDSLVVSTLERIYALHGLEDCLIYQAGGPVADLYQYTEAILPELLKHSPVRPETIITINDVTSLPLPTALASPISIAIYELLENSIQHAFEYTSPANYIHVKLAPGSSEDPDANCLELSVRDSGIGLPDTLENLARKGRGIAIVQFIADKLSGNLDISQGNGASIRLVIPSIDTP